MANTYIVCVDIVAEHERRKRSKECGRKRRSTLRSSGRGTSMSSKETDCREGGRTVWGTNGGEEPDGGAEERSGRLSDKACTEGQRHEGRAEEKGGYRKGEAGQVGGRARVNEGRTCWRMFVRSCVHPGAGLVIEKCASELCGGDLRIAAPCEDGRFLLISIHVLH